MSSRRKSTGTFVPSMPLRRRRNQNGYSACTQLAFVALGCCVSFTSIVVLFLLLHVPHKGSFQKATGASPSTAVGFSSKIRGTKFSHESLASPQINHVYSKALIPQPKYTKNRQVKVALLVHISRALDGRDQTRMVQNLFDSLYMTLECDLHHHNFVILLGFDEIALPFLKREDVQKYARQSLKNRFSTRSKSEYIEDEAKRILEYQSNLKNMKIIFQPLKSSSACYVWNKLAKAAYEIHDADYFYQLDSDSIFMSRCTISQLVHTLAAKDFVPNFGIAAAFAPQYPSIITNALFSRLHMRIFHGQFLPSPPSPSWCAHQEYYLSHLYGKTHTFLRHSIIVTVRKASRSEIILQNSLSQMTSEHFEWLSREIHHGRSIIRNYMKSKFKT